MTFDVSSVDCHLLDIASSATIFTKKFPTIHMFALVVKSWMIVTKLKSTIHANVRTCSLYLFIFTFGLKIKELPIYLKGN